MECYICDGKLNEQKVCLKCKLKLCAFCEERMYDHCEERMCAVCDDDYCQVCDQYLSEGGNGLCRSCLSIAAEEYIEKHKS